MSDAPPPTDQQMPDRRQQPKPPKQQLLSPKTAAEKLGVFLPATPEAFQAESISRDAVAALQADPPEWLRTLRKEGPHPRNEVSRRLGVSNSALARGGVSDSLTTTEIRTLLEERPEWLVAEREKFAPGTGREPGTAIGERPVSAPKPVADDDDEYDGVV
jgi:hypothetical protein